MQVFNGFTGFDWDDANREKNWMKHKLTWWECEEVFFHQPLYVYHDKRHSSEEERYYALGETTAGRPLFIVFTKRKNKLRVISARSMHKKERKVYHEKAQKDTKI